MKRKLKQVKQPPPLDQIQIVIKCLSFLSLPEICSHAAVSKTWNEASYTPHDHISYRQHCVCGEMCLVAPDHPKGLYDLDAVNPRRIKQIVKTIFYEIDAEEYPHSSMFPNVREIWIKDPIEPRHEAFVQDILSQVSEVVMMNDAILTEGMCYPNVKTLVCNEYCGDSEMLPKLFPNIIEFEVVESEDNIKIPYTDGQIQRLVLSLVYVGHVYAYKNAIETVEQLEIEWCDSEMGDEIENLPFDIFANASKLKEISLKSSARELQIIERFLHKFPDHIKVKQEIPEWAKEHV